MEWLQTQQAQRHPPNVYLWSEWSEWSGLVGPTMEMDFIFVEITVGCHATD